MIVVVNGAATEVPAGATLASLVAGRGRDPSGRGVAVAVNGELVPRARWAGTPVRERDRIEILAAAQGG